MNSYNENLQTSVATSLLSLQAEQKTMQSSRDAAMFSLYYAEGAKITANESLDSATGKQKTQSDIKTQAVNVNNISVNLLTSATQQKAYTSQSVTNTAVNASNVQIATNTIIRLAADMGSIYSILKAADMDTEIYTQGKTAYELMSETAYDAERLSQTSMEASALAAGVSAPTVADEVKAGSDLVTSLLGVVSADYDNIAATVTADNAALATASAAEKQVEGTLEFINAEYFATNYAYQLNNKELNLNLNVPADKQTDDAYDVTFAYYKSPFQLAEPKSHKLKPLSTENYPVKAYYVMLVKESKKTVFTLANAESLLQNKLQYIDVAAKPSKPGQTEARVTIIMDELNDSDGDAMDLGKSYVVFVLAELMDDYKKAINDFDDFLSAPSAPFTLTTKLIAPDAAEIKVENNILSFSFKKDTQKGKAAKDDAKEDNGQQENVEYRALFLPDSTDLITGLLSDNNLRTLEKEIEKLEKIADEYDPKIFELEGDIETLQAQKNGYEMEKKELEQAAATPQQTTDAAADETTAAAKTNDEKLKEIKLEIKEVTEKIKAATVALATNQAEKEKAMKSLTPKKAAKPGFFFNITIAEHIPAANYSVFSYNATKKLYEVVIDDATTDNFGNSLAKGKYVPAILVVSTAPAEDQAQYTNAISDHNRTDSFTYPQTTKK